MGHIEAGKVTPSRTFGEIRTRFGRETKGNVVIIGSVSGWGRRLVHRHTP